jgi:hypothetical protein
VQEATGGQRRSVGAAVVAEVVVVVVVVVVGREGTVGGVETSRGARSVVGATSSARGAGGRSTVVRTTTAAASGAATTTAGGEQVGRGVLVAAAVAPRQEMPNLNDPPLVRVSTMRVARRPEPDCHGKGPSAATCIKCCGPINLRPIRGLTSSLKTARSLRRAEMSEEGEGGRRASVTPVEGTNRCGFCYDDRMTLHEVGTLGCRAGEFRRIEGCPHTQHTLAAVVPSERLVSPHCDHMPLVFEPD